MKDEQKPKWFSKHPLIEKFESEEKEKTIKEREQLASELAEVETQRQKGFPEDEGKLQELEQKVKDLQGALESENQEFGKIRAELSGKKESLRIQADKLKSQLAERSDPAIDEAIDFFRNKFEEIRKKNAQRQTTRESVNLINETKKLKTYSNYPAITKAVQYCQCAIRMLESFKLLPVVEAGVIEKLKKGVPSTEEMTEFTSEKPMEGSKGPDPLAWIENDSLYDYKMQKLQESIERIVQGKL